MKEIIESNEFGKCKIIISAIKQTKPVQLRTKLFNWPIRQTNADKFHKDDENHIKNLLSYQPQGGWFFSFNFIFFYNKSIIQYTILWSKHRGTLP